MFCSPYSTMFRVTVHCPVSRLTVNAGGFERAKRSKILS